MEWSIDANRAIANPPEVANAVMVRARELQGKTGDKVDTKTNESNVPRATCL
jgi:hypothetical protein